MSGKEMRLPLVSQFSVGSLDLSYLCTEMVILPSFCLLQSLPSPSLILSLPSPTPSLSPFLLPSLYVEVEGRCEWVDVNERWG